jgi:rubrerythrin
MEQPTTMDGVERALDRAEQLERENLNTYDIYAAITDHIGLKRLLSSLMEDGKSHLQELEEFRARADTEERFDETKAGSIGDLESSDVEYSFDASMDYIDFLRTIFEREEALVAVYDALAGAAADNDAGYLFKRLAEDGRKHAWLAKDRYDLERLK